MESQTLTERFGSFTVSVPVRDLIRDAAIQALSADMPVMLPSTRRIVTPAIGEYWAEQHGIFGGRYIDELDRLYALIVSRRAEGQIGQFKWVDANKRAAALRIGGLTDWTLFNRIEGVGSFERLQPKLNGTENAFPEEYHWTSQRVGSFGAWCQHFNYGYSYWLYQGSELWARAVRRVILN